MQQHIQTAGNLLSPDGRLAHKGYSTQAMLTYNREQIRAAPWKIKEWDFYQVSTDDFCLQLTIGHISYAGDVSVKMFEYSSGHRVDYGKTVVLPFNRLKMPRSAEQGDLTYRTKNFLMQFTFEEGGRRLICRANGDGAPNIDIDIHLSQPDLASIVMSTPFDEDPRCFYYNHKINCMPASGTAKVGDREYRFESGSAFGLLDWGRGVWPFSHEWFWGSGSGYVNGGKRFGFNIGYGFGNTAAATENALFYEGSVHKIGHVYFDLAGSGGYMAPKQFTSDDGRFEMTFTPIYDRYTETKMLWVDNHCHQIFGKFSGKAVLDDGTVIEIKDFMAFAEHAVNRW